MISAPMTTPTVEPDTTTPPVEAIMPLLRFTAADLAANQQGSLSAAQQARLQQLQTRLIAIGVIVFFVMALLATGFLYGGATGSTPILSFVGVMLTVLNAIVVGMLARQWMRLNADVRAGNIEILSGKLERVLRAGRQMNNYVLRLNQVDFAVNKETFKVFRHEQQYRFYRTPHSRILLSAEPQ
jgi:hypothetical protein